jgi:DNA polymerase-4
LTGLERHRAAARQVKAGVIEETGLGCSIGIAPSKLIAKIASDADKPDGFLELTQDEACERFADASPGLIPGIGPKTRERLERQGITTLGRLASVPDSRLAEWFGSNLGPHLGRLARFEDERPLETVRVAKSESRETTFDSDLVGLEALEPVLDRLGGELCETLGGQGRRGRTIGIKVRFADFRTVTRARTIDEPASDPDTVLGIARELLRELDPPQPVRLLGVRVAGLDEEGRRHTDAAPRDQLSLSL